MNYFFQSSKDVFLIDGFPRNEENLETWNILMADKVNVSTQQVWSTTTIWNQNTNSSETFENQTSTMGIRTPTIQNPDFLKVLFQIKFLNGQAITLAIAMVPTIQNTYFFGRISNAFGQNGIQLSGFRMVGFSGFQIPFKICIICKPISSQPF